MTNLLRDLLENLSTSELEQLSFMISVELKERETKLGPDSEQQEFDGESQ